MNESTNHPFPLLRLLLALCLFIGGGCAGDNAVTRVPVASDVRKPVEVQKPVSPENEKEEPVEAPKPEPPAFELIKSYKPKSSSSVAPLQGENIQFDRGKMVQLTIEDMPLPEFIDFFFGKLMGVSYTLNPLLQTMMGTKVNINLQQEFPLGQLYPLILNLLQESGVGGLFSGRGLPFTS